MKYSKHILILCLFLASWSVSCQKGEQADLVLHGGKIVTVDENFAIQEAVAFTSGKIIFIGSNEEIKKFIGKKTEAISLEGKLVLPGLIDAHGHLHSLGDELTYLYVTETTSFQQIVDKVTSGLNRPSRVNGSSAAKLNTPPNKSNGEIN